MYFSLQPTTDFVIRWGGLSFNFGEKFHHNLHESFYLWLTVMCLKKLQKYDEISSTFVLILLLTYSSKFSKNKFLCVSFIRKNHLSLLLYGDFISQFTYSVKQNGKISWKTLLGSSGNTMWAKISAMKKNLPMLGLIWMGYYWNRSNLSFEKKDQLVIKPLFKPEILAD